MATVTMNNRAKFLFTKRGQRQTNVEGMEVLFKFTGTADETLTMPIAAEVIDCHVVMTGAGAASDTITITDGSNTIIAAIDCSSASDADVLRAASVDDAYSSLSVGDTLVCDRASACNADVYVRAVIND